MATKENNMSLNHTKTVFLVFINAIVLKTAYTMNEWWYGMLLITLPLLCLSIYEQVKDKISPKKKLQKLSTQSIFSQAGSTTLHQSNGGTVFTNTATTTSTEALSATGVKPA